MSSDSTRSEQVVNDFKKHKLAVSAIRRIHEIIRSFEKDRAFDARLARIGIAIILALVGFAVYYLLGTDSVVLS